MKNTYATIFALILTACADNANKSVEVSENKLDIKHQILELELDWEQKSLKGAATIQFSSSKSTKTIEFDSAKLHIDSVLHDGKLLEFQIKERDEKIVIDLGTKIQIGEEIEVTIAYRTTHKNESDPNNIWGSFGKGVRFFEPSLTEKERRYQVWTVSEPESSKYWYPTNDDLSDVRTTEVIVTIKNPMIALSNGTLISSKNVESSQRMFHWKTSIPHQPHHTFLAIGEYDNYRQSAGRVVLNNYGYPDEREGTKESVVRLPDMIRFYSSYTGHEYPYKEYSQTFVQDFGGWKGGRGNALITENMIDDKTTHEDFLYGWDLTEGEALAYQWFGSHIMPKGWKDVWLAKGFSRYFSGLYNQHKNGNTEFLTYQLTPDLGAYLSDWNSKINTIIVPDSIGDIEKFVNGNTPYTKAALVLHMLRNELGEVKWKKTIKTYMSRFGGESVATEDFIGIVNEVNEKSMDWFFKQWVYGVGHPKFRIVEKYDSAAQKLTIDIYQTQHIDSMVYGKQIPFFRGKTSIEIDDTVEKIQLLPKEQNTFSFSLLQKPKLINFDFEDVWIKEVSFEKKTNQLITELRSSDDVLHRREIMQKLTAIATDNNTEKNTISAIEAVLRNSALTESYWRMRLIALWQLQSIYSTKFSNESLNLNKEMEQMLLTLIKREKSWMKAWATNFLGMTKDKKYVPLYLEGLKDYSDRVVFMSAIALGKTKHPRAFEALKNLPNKPSWKNQSLISALYGFKELEDPRAYHIALRSLTDSDNPHWNLSVPIWDHRLAAAHTLKALKKTEEGSEMVLKNLKNAMGDGNLNDIFYNAQTLGILGGDNWEEGLNMLKDEFDSNAAAMNAITNLEKQFPVN